MDYGNNTEIFIADVSQAVRNISTDYSLKINLFDITETENGCELIVWLNDQKLIRIKISKTLKNKKAILNYIKAQLSD